MKKLILALVIVLLVVPILATPVLADGCGVSATDLGRCTCKDHGPGNGRATYLWVPEPAYENLNGGNSGLHFHTP